MIRKDHEPLCICSDCMARPTPDEKLVKRLRRTIDSGQRTLGGGSCGGKNGPTSYGGEPIMKLANPDGPEAADTIERLSAALAAKASPACDDWRCVNCKLVVSAPHEPDRCFACSGRSFAHIAKASPAVEVEVLLRELRDVAVALHRKHYWEVKQWKPLDSARGILSQIDNMTTGLERIRESSPAVEVERLREALRPFANFADPRRTIPATHVLTSGSEMARRQLTMGDCYSAADAIAALTNHDDSAIWAAMLLDGLPEPALLVGGTEEVM